ncbi:energy-coupling factor ABC transporter substrate-binding protein [Archaeoglobus veneficus]|uniref:energy-coupling factor ABC transporter substrate-binding protein n=1 Tax=Archaeoglobus veneficus TaxID=58290 RepID=UPI0018DBE458
MFLLFTVLLTSPALADEWSGADDKAEEAITEINPNYEPWFSPLWEPPSGEIESLLFSLQAAIGAGIIGYFLGYNRGKAHARD